MKSNLIKTNEIKSNQMKLIQIEKIGKWNHMKSP